MVYFTSKKNEEYIEAEVVLVPNAGCENAVLSITFDTANTLYIGSASLMPEDNFYGMRKDVIELLKKMGVSILRWPGGNFAGEYNWKDGLLSSNMRAPLQSYLNLETQPHTEFEKTDAHFARRNDCYCITMPPHSIVICVQE